MSCTENNKYLCIVCNYVTSRKSSLDKHFSTDKHIQCASSIATGDAVGDASCDGKVAKCNKPKQEKIYSCSKCSKVYNSRNGIWKHKQLCVEEEIKPIEPSDQNLLSFLIKQNQEFKDLMIQQNKMIVDAMKQHSITNINQVNSNNTFNLQVFLLEDCKDAMDMSEFLESIKFQLADVEAVGELGYVNGISKLIIQNLKGLDVTKRPIHCTDEKREIIYIKEAGVWVKDEDNSKLRRLIKTVSNRNFKHTRLYKEKHPDCVTAESKYSDTYNKIVLEATGGGSKCNDYESENKIMKKIAKAITIDKSAFLTNPLLAPPFPKVDKVDK
jgi:hypothetical protein